MRSAAFRRLQIEKWIVEMLKARPAETRAQSSTPRDAPD